MLKSNGSSVSVTRSVAETVSVKADPSPPPRTALPEQLVLGKRDATAASAARGRRREARASYKRGCLIDSSASPRRFVPSVACSGVTAE